MTQTLAPLPKVIYSLWLQGVDQAPEVVKLNFRRWERLNPAWQLRVLDLGDVRELLRDFSLNIETLAPQALSDIVRSKLLLENGGVWADASVFPVRPLDDWLLQQVSSNGFFAFERPAPDRPISSWFIACAPRHPIFVHWWREIERFWAKPRRITTDIPADPGAAVSPAVAESTDTAPYFWFHYLFQYLLETNAEVAACWNACMKISAVAPHALQALFQKSPRPSEADIARHLWAAPVQKLNWRTSYPLDVFDRVGTPSSGTAHARSASAILPDRVTAQQTTVIEVRGVPGHAWSKFDDHSAETEVVDFLYALVRLVKPTHVLETGTWIGLSASAVSLGLQANGFGTLVTLEIRPDAHAEAQRNLARYGVASIVDARLGSSLDYVPDRKFDMLVLDADPQQCVAEFARFAASLNRGAFVILRGTADPYGSGQDAVRQLVASGQLIAAINFPCPQGLFVGMLAD